MQRSGLRTVQRLSRIICTRSLPHTLGSALGNQLNLFARLHYIFIGKPNTAPLALSQPEQYDSASVYVEIHTIDTVSTVGVCGVLSDS